MYLRLVKFGLADGKHDIGKKLADELVPLIGRQPGCKSALCFGDDSSGEFGLVVVWESQEAAHAAAAIFGPQLEKRLSGNLKQPPERALFKVLASSP